MQYDRQQLLDEIAAPLTMDCRSWRQCTDQFVGNAIRGAARLRESLRMLTHGRVRSSADGLQPFAVDAPWRREWTQVSFVSLDIIGNRLPDRRIEIPSLRGYN